MDRDNQLKPTEAELEILTVLWAVGPSTVRFVNERLNESRKVGYTTTLKLMQIMHEKGLLARDEQARSHVYRPMMRENLAQKALLDRVMETAFGGSALKLVMQALGGQKTSREELAAIREYIDRLESGHDH